MTTGGEQEDGWRLYRDGWRLSKQSNGFAAGGSSPANRDPYAHASPATTQKLRFQIHVSEVRNARVVAPSLGYTCYQSVGSLLHLWLLNLLMAGSTTLFAVYHIYLPASVNPLPELWITSVTVNCAHSLEKLGVSTSDGRNNMSLGTADDTG